MLTLAEETETAERTSMKKCCNKQGSGEREAKGEAGEAGEGEQVRVQAHEARRGPRGDELLENPTRWCRGTGRR